VKILDKSIEFAKPTSIELNSAYEVCYLSKSQQQAFQRLRYSLNKGNGIVTLTGSEGCGKTVSINYYTQFLSSNNIPNSCVSALNIPETSTQFDYVDLLIIDDAHFLTSQHFQQMESHIQRAKQEYEKYLIILVGNDKLDELLMHKDRKQFRKEIFFSFRLTLLDKEESKHFAQSILKTRNWSIFNTLPDNKLEQIVSSSNGNLRSLTKNLETIINKQSNPHREKTLKSQHTSTAMMITPDIYSLENNPSNLEIKIDRSVNQAWYKSPIVKTLCASYIASMIMAVIYFHGIDLEKAKMTNVVEQPQNLTQPVESPPLLAQLNPETDIVANQSRYNNNFPAISSSIEEVVVDIKTEKVNPEKLINLMPASVHNVSNAKPLPNTNLPVTNKVNSIASTENKDKKREIIKPLAKPKMLTNSMEPKLQLASISKLPPHRSTNLNPEKLNTGVNEIDLNRLVAEFIVAYEFGDSDIIDDMLLETVKSNDINNKTELLDAYNTLFNITQSRIIDIRDVNWKKEGSTILGFGSFKVTTYERGTAHKETYFGSIVLRVIEKNKSLKFSELFYYYENI